MKLADWLKREGRHGREFAREIGVHYVTLSKWGIGENMPRPDKIRRIEDATGGAVTYQDFAAAWDARREIVG